jgi:uncharacterized damage-inducible protein DinB
VDFQQALELLNETSIQLSAFAASCSDEALNKRITYRNLAGQEFTNPFHEILMHVVNHSTYHAAS